MAPSSDSTESVTAFQTGLWRHKETAGNMSSSFLRAALSWSGAASMETAPALRSTRSPRTP